MRRFRAAAARWLAGGLPAAGYPGEHARLLAHCWNDGYAAGVVEGARLAREALRG